MAEKATADVLAILENNGMSDACEPSNSDSDQDTLHESKEMMSSVNSKGSENEMEELSGSELDTSSVQGGSLSWKGHNGSPHNGRKHKDLLCRGWSNSSSLTSSTSNRRSGRSCHQIKCKETRLERNELKTEPIRENETASFLEGYRNFSDEMSRMLREGGGVDKGKEVLLDDLAVWFSENNGSMRHDMEQALAHQAQLIDQYEAMEKVQRDWEEKFKEDNANILDLFEPGIHSDIYEHTAEIMPQAPNSSSTSTSLAREAKSFQAETSGFPPPVCNLRDVGDQKSTTLTTFSEPPAKEFAFSATKGDRTRESQNNARYLIPHESLPLDGVLESLKQARLSLQQKIIILPLIESESSVKDTVDVPAGQAGLFRLPTDFSVEASNQMKLLGPESQLRSSYYFTDERFTTKASNQSSSSREDYYYVTSPFRDTRSSFYGDDHLQMGRISESGRRSTFSGPMPHFDPYLDPTCSYNYHSVPDLHILPRNEGFSRLTPNRVVVAPPTDCFSFYGDQIRPNM